MQAGQLRNGIADASTSAVFRERRYLPAIDASAAAWCDRLTVIFIERDHMGEVLIEI
jgi:hypothetical protein